MTLPKSLGGLGIRDLGTMNKVCLMKMGWALRKNSDTLWSQVLNGKYRHGLLQRDQVVVKGTISFIQKGIART